MYFLFCIYISLAQTLALWFFLCFFAFFPIQLLSLLDRIPYTYQYWMTCLSVYMENRSPYSYYVCGFLFGAIVVVKYYMRTHSSVGHYTVNDRYISFSRKELYVCRAFFLDCVERSEMVWFYVCLSFLEILINELVAGRRRADVLSYFVCVFFFSNCGKEIQLMWT